MNHFRCLKPNTGEISPETQHKPVPWAALLFSTDHGAEAPQTGYPEQLTDPAEQRITMQAEVTLGDETVYTLLP